MKQIALLVGILIAGDAIAQKNEDNKNQISFGVISSLEVDGMGSLMSDNWIVLSNLLNMNNRSYQKFGLEMKYYRTVGNCQLGLRFGVINRKIEEKQKFIGYWDSSAPNPIVYRISDYSLEYSQRNYTAGIGIRRKASIGPLTISCEFLGLLARVGPSKQVYRELYQYHDDVGMPNQEHSHWNFYWDTDGGWMVGPGGELSVGLVVLKRITFSTGIGMYFLYTHFDGEVVHWQESYTDDRFTHAIVEGTYERFDALYQLEYSQWSFSKPMMSLRLEVDF